MKTRRCYTAFLRIEHYIMRDAHVAGHVRVMWYLDTTVFVILIDREPGDDRNNEWFDRVIVT